MFSCYFQSLFWLDFLENLTKDFTLLKTSPVSISYLRKLNLFKHVYSTRLKSSKHLKMSVTVKRSSINYKMHHLICVRPCVRMCVEVRVCVRACLSDIEIQTIGLISVKFKTVEDHELGRFIVYVRLAS